MLSSSGALLTRSSSGSSGIGEVLPTESSIQPEVCFLKGQTHKHQTKYCYKLFPHLCRGQSGKEGTVA